MTPAVVSSVTCGVEPREYGAKAEMSFVSRSLHIALRLLACLATFAAAEGQDQPSQRLWERPEMGRPIDLQWSPAGSQLFVYLRPAAIEQNEYARRALRVFEPRFGATIDRWLQIAGVEPSQLDSILWTIGNDQSSTVRTVAIARLTAEQPARPPSDPTRSGLSGSTDFGSWVADERVVIVGPMATLLEIHKAGGQPPFLNRAMSQLLSTTSDAEHFVLFGAPNFLLRDVPGWFEGDGKELLEPLEQLLTEQAQAASVSLRVTEEEAYAELRMQVTLERRRSLRKTLPKIATTTKRLAEDRWQRLQPADAYWGRLSERLPQMLEFAGSHVRTGWDDDQAVLNISLPPSAAHNLMLAADLLVAEDESTTETQNQQLSLRELLALRFEYEFGQRSFDDAFLGLAREFNAARPMAKLKIVIDGRRLQLAGVTRNQELENFAVGQKPIGQILTLLTMRANPSRVARPSDPQQVIVWTIGTDPDDPKAQVVLVTSRQAAAENRLVLPKYYRGK